jgi:MAF protein
MPRQLILASTSEPRRELLRRLMIPFEIAGSDVDETPLDNESAEDIVLRLAETKARAVAGKFPDALIIGADQLGVVDGKIQGKPLSYENAKLQLREASGKKIEFFIGLCLLDARDNSRQLVLEKFDVVYRQLTDAMIENYLRKELPLHCAGSCMADGLGITLIEEFQGKDFSALIGLPLIHLVKMLETAGLNPLS